MCVCTSTSPVHIPIPYKIRKSLAPCISTDLDKEIIRLAEEKNVKLLAYITPHLNVQGSLYKSVQEKPYFMTTESGETYLMNFGEFFCATVDFTVPEAVEWYKRK